MRHARLAALLLLCLFVIYASTAVAAPDWPSLPTNGEILAAARAYGEKYSGRQDLPTMPGSPPDGSYNQTSYEASRVLTFHNPKIADPVASGEAFVILHVVSEDVRPSGRNRREEFMVVRIVHSDGKGFAVAHVNGWSKLPGDAELFPFLGAHLNGYYSQTLYDGYSSNDTWLPGFATGDRKITITGYDGHSDTTHMPFTFHVAVVDAGRPAADADVGLRFFGEVRALGDRFAVWSDADKKWIETSGVNLALQDLLPVRLDGRGQLVVRGYLDFDRMHRFGLSLPVEVGIEIAAEGAPPKRASVRLRHPAFVRNVYFWCANDPQWPGSSRWIRLSYLSSAACDRFIERTEEQVFAGVRMGRNRYGVGSEACYPSPFEIPKRVLINGKPFSPPDWERDYFYPLNAKDELILDLAQSGKVARGGFSPMMGDGVMVEMFWLDGVTALFAQRRDEDGDFLAVTLPGTADALPGTAEQTWIRYFVGETADWLVTDRLIEAAVVSGATVVGGPVAGAWAVVICEAGLKIKDIKELAEAGTTRHKVVLVRSRVAVTGRPGGGQTLYTYEGSPAVLSGGREVRARAGESIDFAVGGAVSPAVRSKPPAEADAMRAALPQRDAPVGSKAVAPKTPRGSTATRPVARPVAPPPNKPPKESELAAAKREYDEAYEAYTTLVTTGGSGDVNAALARYKAAYERYEALKGKK